MTRLRKLVYLGKFIAMIRSIRIVVLAVACFISFAAASQENTTEGSTLPSATLPPRIELNIPKIDFRPDITLPIYIKPSQDAFVSKNLSISPELLQLGSNNKSYYTPPIIFERNIYARDWNSSGIISAWYNGAIFGSGGYTTYAGIGSIGSAQIGITQIFDRFTFTGSISANKYNLANGAFNNFGASGKVSFKINDKLSFNVFGSAQSNNTLYSPAAMSVLSYSSYGGSLSVKFSESFGADFGAQRCYDPYTGRWRTLPIVAPYINIKGAKIGMDIGPIILDVIQGIINSDSNGNYRGNPTIRPTPPLPIFGRYTDR